MTVYVDSSVYRYRQMIMCHMMADTLEELHQMADTIGVKRKWFQDHGKYLHYDICKAKRTIAVKNGAVETTTKEIIKRFRNG